jgi:hypothetical protein
MGALEKAVKSRRPLVATVIKSKMVLTAEASGDMGGDMSLSNWRRGRPVTVRIRDKFTGEQEVTITPSPIGPMKVITHGRKAGVSARRRSSGRRYGASAGKGTWDRGRNRVYTTVPKTFRTEQMREVAKAFKS